MSNKITATQQEFFAGIVSTPLYDKVLKKVLRENFLSKNL